MNKILLFFNTCKNEGINKAIVRMVADLLGLRISGFHEKNTQIENFLQKYNISKEVVTAPVLINDSIKRAMYYEPEKVVPIVNTCIAQTLINYGTFLNATGTEVYSKRKEVFESILLIHNNQKYYEHLAKIICNRWQWEGPSEELFDWCSQILKNDNKKSELQQKVFLIYVSSLLEMKKKDEAKAVLRNYYEKYGKDKIHLYYPVAMLAEEMNIVNPLIKKAACICKTLLMNENKLGEYVKGKSVAVVGSGPYELGKKRGSEIDSHEIIIRFNDYQLSGYEDDYGSKTNIWVRNTDTENGGCKPRLQQINFYDLVVLETDIWRFAIPDIFLDTFYEYATKIPSKFCKLKYRDKLIREMGSFPTSGMEIIYEIFQIKGNVVESDIYGVGLELSTFDNKELKHYGEKSEYKISVLHHNKWIESKYISAMLNRNTN